MKIDDIDLSHVHYHRDGGYTVHATIRVGKSTAEFQIDLPKRRERNPYVAGKQYRHHKKPFEDLEAEARRSVRAICSQIAEELAEPSKSA